MKALLVAPLLIPLTTLVLCLLTRRSPRLSGLLSVLGSAALGTIGLLMVWLAASGQIPATSLDELECLGELALSGDLRPGMQLLLCSDGLTEEVDDRAIGQVLSHIECSAQECVDGLVAAALDGGGSDNVTVLLVRRH